MELAADQLDEMREHFSKVMVAAEANKPYILLSPLVLPAGCSPESVDGLLCPTDRDGYPSRLFFSQKITGGRAGLNWNADGIRILERNWFAFSWRTNRDNLRFWQMVLDHLAALR